MSRSKPAAVGGATEERVRWVPGFGAPWVHALSVIEGPDPGQVHRVNAKETVIGRDTLAEFTVEDDQVSKKHCVIRTEGGVCTVMDLGSTNGTRLNHRELEPGVARRVRHLDELELGDVRILVLTGKYKAKVRCGG